MKTLIKIITVIGLTTLLCSCGRDKKQKKPPVATERKTPVEAEEKVDTRLDLSTIIGKSIEEVNEVLGTPIKEEKIKYGQRLKYPKIEIVFINGRSDWITLNMRNSKFKVPQMSFVSKSTFDAGTSYEYTYIKCFTR
jgi:hypothetical protein